MTVIEAYQKAVNQIDDYFEYRFESEQDREFVITVIDILLKDLIKINKEKLDT